MSEDVIRRWVSGRFDELVLDEALARRVCEAGGDNLRVTDYQDPLATVELRAIGTLHGGLMTKVFSLWHTAELLKLNVPESLRVAPDWPDVEQTTAPGVALLVLLVLLTQFNDVAQYL